MNQVYLMGNVVADPQPRVISPTLKVANFSVAVEDKNKDKTISYYDVCAWQKTADIIVQHFTKGSKIALMGHLKQETWEKDGKKNSKITVVADSILNIPARERSSQSAPAQVPVAATDDIPF